MVTYFNKKDLVEFGKYLLSNERKEFYKSHPGFKDQEQLKERLSNVNDSDLRNFIERKQNKPQS